MVAIVLFAVLLALFALPGYAWVGWLHRADAPDRATRVVLGWVWSFAVFALATGPFLWLHGNRTTCLATAGAAWCAFAAVAAFLYVRSSRRDKENAARAPAPKEARPAPARPQPAVGQKGAPAVLALYAALVGAVLGLWATGGEPRHVWITRVLPLVFLLGALLALALRRSWDPLLRFGPEDDAAPPRLWTILAAALILFQAVAVLFYTRPDWDDCFTLAAALDYQQVENLNEQEPTHREGFPMPPIYWLMCWELWGAALGRAAGLGPLVVYHTLLPAFLVLACYAAYRALLAEILPRRWVPLALLGLCGFHLWGISTLGNASNHFLLRIAQGKSVLLHFALPLTATALIRFARQPGPRWWLTLCACVVAGLGLSTSALFLGVSLVVCLAAALLPVVPAGRRVAFAAGSALALSPTLGVGFLIWSAVHGDTVFDRPGDYTSWQRWFAEWDVYAGKGSAEVVWLVALPLLFVLLGEWRRRAYLVGMPAVLLLTFGNPFLLAVVAAKMTSGLTYYRLFWLYPVGMGLGALLALLARLAGKVAARFGETRVALAACLVGLSASAALPGAFVWGDANSIGAYMFPQPVENVEAMPPDLKVIARLLAAEPDIEGHRIVCGEEVASFLTPFDRRFRYVTTRQGYTIYHVGRNKSASEAAERLYLTDAIRLGPGFPRLTEAGWEMIVFTVAAAKDPPRPDPWPTLEHLPELLDRYRVGYAVASPAVGYTREESQFLTLVRDRTLSENGFRRVYRGVDYSLWKRDGPAAAGRSDASRPPAATVPARPGSPNGRGRPR